MGWIKAFGALLAGSLLLVGTEVRAVESVTYDNVSLSAEVYREVARDELWATVNVFAKGKDRRAIAERVTEKVNKVFATAKKRPEVSASLVDRGARRVHDDGRQEDVWIDESRILFKSKNFPEVYDLLGEVQDWAAISDMSFMVSREKADEIGDELVRSGIGLFKEKAEFVKERLGGSGYDMVEMRIDADEPSRYVGARSMAVMNTAGEGAGGPAMDVDSGDEKLGLRVTGVVRIRR